MVALAAGLVAPNANAQDFPSELEDARVQVGFQGLVGFPRGEFADNVGLSGGLNGDFKYRLGDTPLRVGAGMSVLIYGQARRRVPFSSTIPDVLVDVTTSSGILTSYGLLRVQPVQGRVRPYADGLIGLNYVFTQTTVDLDDDVFADRRRVSTTNFKDFAFAVGGGGGVMFDVVRWEGGRVSLDFGARYVFGGEADYLTTRRGVPVRSVDDLELNRSRTNVIVAVLGGAVEF